MPNLARSSMSKTDLILLSIFILGFLLFLYGAKFYDAVVGYSGIYLFIGTIGAYLLIYIYKELTKKAPGTS
jgi:multisubunit Na+/H+ antiporter MnhB subunit